MKYSQMDLVVAVFAELDRQMKKAGVPKDKRVLIPRHCNAVVDGVNFLLAQLERPEHLAGAAAGLAAWLASDDTGMSSKTMAAHLCGAPIEERSRTAHPWDPADFGRCHRFLEAVPEARPLVPRMAEVSPVWAALAAAWRELTALYLEELPTGRAPLLYKRMKELIDGAK